MTSDDDELNLHAVPEAENPENEDDSTDAAPSTASDDAEATGDRDSGDDTAAEDAADEKPRRKWGIEKRFHDLTEKLRAAEVALQAREEEVERVYGLLQRGQSPEQAAGTRDADAEPDRNQFDDYEQFLEARARWVAREAVRSEYEQRERAQVQQSQQAVAAAKEARWAEAHNDAFERLDGYEKAFDTVGTSINEDVADAIKSSEAPADVVYWLARNPTTLQGLRKMTGPEAHRAIGRIEERLTTTAPRSAAPTPPNPVRGNTSGTKNPLDMRLTTDQWIQNRQKLRQKQMRSRE